MPLAFALSLEEAAGRLQQVRCRGRHLPLAFALSLEEAAGRLQQVGCRGRHSPLAFALPQVSRSPAS
ncbi:MAG TPA: hypothetical protein VEC19_03680 [Usitatibacter sp.]|nr:hypothetical protein [Usitatibacter sp.]